MSLLGIFSAGLVYCRANSYSEFRIINFFLLYTYSEHFFMVENACANFLNDPNFLQLYLELSAENSPISPQTFVLPPSADDAKKKL